MLTIIPQHDRAPGGRKHFSELVNVAQLIGVTLRDTVLDAALLDDANLQRFHLLGVAGIC